MVEHGAVVGIFKSHTEAETSIKELQRAGFDMKKLSIVGKDYHTEEQVVGYYNVSDRMKFWGKQGAYWGGFWGLLFGSAVFVIPGVGPLVMFGPVIGWLVGALEGAVAVGGVSALAAAQQQLAGVRDGAQIRPVPCHCPRDGGRGHQRQEHSADGRRDTGRHPSRRTRRNPGLARGVDLQRATSKAGTRILRKKRDNGR